jgi:hypothetical protein
LKKVWSIVSDLERTLHPPARIAGDERAVASRRSSGLFERFAFGLPREPEEVAQAGGRFGRRRGVTTHEAPLPGGDDDVAAFALELDPPACDRELGLPFVRSDEEGGAQALHPCAPRLDVEIATGRDVEDHAALLDDDRAPSALFDLGAFVQHGLASVEQRDGLGAPARVFVNQRRTEDVARQKETEETRGGRDGAEQRRFAHRTARPRELDDPCGCGPFGLSREQRPEHTFARGWIHPRGRLGSLEQLLHVRLERGFALRLVRPCFGHDSTSAKDRLSVWKVSRKARRARAS